MASAPLIALSSLLSVLCGVLEAARFYYQNEVLTRVIARASRGGTDAAVDSWTATLRQLLTTQLLSALASIARSQASRMGRAAFVARLKVDLFAALVKQDVAYFERNDLWETRHLIGNADFVCASLLELPVTLAEGVSRIAAAMALLASQSPAMAVLMLALLPLKQALARALDRLQRRAERAQGTAVAPRGAMNAVWASLVDPVALKTMRAFAREPAEIADFSRAVRAKDAADEKGALAFELFSPARDLLDRLTDLAGVWYGGVLVSAGRMRAADLPAFVSLASDTFDRARFLHGFVQHAGEDVLDPVEAMQRLLLSRPSIGVDTPAYPGPTIEDFSVRFDDVAFAYPTQPETAVLRGVTFSVGAGERVGIMGESGCGKSTLFALLIRLYDADRGTVALGGVPVQRFNPLWLRERVLLVSQSTFLARRTVRENLLFARTRPQDEAKEVPQQELDAAIALALRRAQCAFFLDDKERFPKGLQTDLGVNASKLSGGERQRLALARALLARPAPRVLLLDEHTSALDESSQRLVQLALEEVWRESRCTVLAIAHRLSNFRGMDRVVVLSRRGVVAEQGAPRDILRLYPDGIFAGLCVFRFRFRRETHSSSHGALSCSVKQANVEF